MYNTIIQRITRRRGKIIEEKKQTAAQGVSFIIIVLFHQTTGRITIYIILLRRGHRSPSPKDARTLQVHILCTICTPMCRYIIWYVCVCTGASYGALNPFGSTHVPLFLRRSVSQVDYTYIYIYIIYNIYLPRTTTTTWRLLLTYTTTTTTIYLNIYI